MTEHTAENLVNRENNDDRNWYEKNYKKLLLIPAILLILSLVYIGYFISVNGDFIKKDVSLTGGTSVTIFSENINIEELSSYLSQNIGDYNIRELTDFRSGRQQAVVIESQLQAGELSPILEEFIGYKLTSENSSFESTGSTLGQSFYLQLIYALILSFSFMAIVVLFLFGGHWKLKLLFIVLTAIPPILFFSRVISVNYAIIASALLLIIEIPVYLKYSVPSAAVVISAFADIIMTLAFVDLIGMRISSAGIIAFLMLIGYSVDTDIMLTTRVLKREKSPKQFKEAFITGMTMTITSIIAITIALLITQTFSEILRQIFLILLIGLGFDILNTWITNASILKWYLERRHKK